MGFLETTGGDLWFVLGPPGGIWIYLGNGPPCIYRFVSTFKYIQKTMVFNCFPILDCLSTRVVCERLCEMQYACEKMYVERISFNTGEVCRVRNGSLVAGYSELPTGGERAGCIHWCIRIYVYRLVYTLVKCVYSAQGSLVDRAVPLYYCTP